MFVFFDLELVLICDKMYPKREEFNMKKIVSIAVLAALTATVADAAPSYIARNSDGGYNVTYNYTDKAKTGWYVGARAELSFLNFDVDSVTTRLANPAGVFEGVEEYSLETLFGGSLFAGKTFNYFWRAELEAGLIGQLEDKGDDLDFKMTVPYVMANGYYDFTNGLYVGAGLGIALPKTEFDTIYLDSGDRKEQTVSPMVGIMLGYAHELDYNLTLDIRYRLAAFQGVEHNLDASAAGVANGLVSFKNEIDLILDNSLSIGIRYNF